MPFSLKIKTTKRTIINIGKSPSTDHFSLGMGDFHNAPPMSSTSLLDDPQSVWNSHPLIAEFQAHQARMVAEFDQMLPPSLSIGPVPSTASASTSQKDRGDDGDETEMESEDAPPPPYVKDENDKPTVEYPVPMNASCPIDPNVGMSGAATSSSSSQPQSRNLWERRWDSVETREEGNGTRTTKEFGGHITIGKNWRRGRHHPEPTSSSTSGPSKVVPPYNEKLRGSE